MGENHEQLYKGLISRNYKELWKLNSKKMQVPINEWTIELNKQLSKEI